MKFSLYLHNYLLGDPILHLRFMKLYPLYVRACLRRTAGSLSERSGSSLVVFTDFDTRIFTSPFGIYLRPIVHPEGLMKLQGFMSRCREVGLCLA